MPSLIRRDVPVFDTIVLLAGSAEDEILERLLISHNASLSIRRVTTSADLDAVPSSVLERSRLVAFATSVIVPGRILDQLGFGAYNFHPGPPHYPGWAPAHFACYDRAKTFGATAHVMFERVDEGPIVAVELFDVPPGASVEVLAMLAYRRLARMFWSLAEALATRPDPLPVLPVRWQGRKSARRLGASLCEVSADISKDALDHLVAVFGCGGLEFGPTISLHGHRFRYVGECSGAVAPTAAGPAQEKDVA